MTTTTVQAFNKPREHFQMLSEAGKAKKHANSHTARAKTPEQHKKAADAHHEAAQRHLQIVESPHSSPEEREVAKKHADAHAKMAHAHAAKHAAGKHGRLTEHEAHGGGAHGGDQARDVEGRFASNNTQGAVCSYAFAPGEPPDAIRLWRRGVNFTDYGEHHWSERSASVVLAEYQRRGNPLLIDIEHNGAEKGNPATPHPTGGYAHLELRDGEPWLVFDWSAYAIDQIRTRQRLFLSPEYDVSRESGEIVRLVRVSLVADPGTHHARMLARIRAAKGTAMDPEQVKAAFEALKSQDAEKAMAILEAMLIAQASGGAAAAPASEPAPDMAAAAPAADGGDMPPDEDKKKEPVAAAAPEDKKMCAAPAPNAETLAMAQRIAELEARDKARAAREAELEADARVAAAGARIPESLRAFAKRLSADDFKTFVDGLPIVVEAQGKTVTAGVRASSKPARGDTKGRPDGELPEEQRVHLARVFGTETRPEESVTELADGRIRATHLFRPGTATTNGADR